MAHRWTHLLVVAMLTLLTACSSAGTEENTQRGAEPSGQVADAARQDVPSALDDRDNSAFPAPMIDPDELISGGPRPTASPRSTHRCSSGPTRSTGWRTTNPCCR